MPDSAALLPTPDQSVLFAKFFQGLAHSVRLRIVMLLVDGEKNVGELTRLLGLSQAHVSNHLACLKWCGFVATRQEGRNVYYAVADPRIRQIVSLGQAVVVENAARIAACRRM